MNLFTLIAAALGWTEVPDTDGLFLQNEEAQKIEQKLADADAAAALAATAAQEAATSIENLNGRITALEGEVSAANADKTTLANNISEKETALTTANNRIAELEAMPGKGAATVTTEDPANGPSETEKNKKYLTVYDRM
jgi:peptidoglycan hydrolase CwlO-like protein